MCWEHTGLPADGKVRDLSRGKALRLGKAPMWSLSSPGAYSSCHTSYTVTFQGGRGSGEGKEGITLHLRSSGQFPFGEWGCLHPSKRRLHDNDMMLFLSQRPPAVDSWVSLGLGYMCVRVHTNAAVSLACVCSQGLTQPLENAVPAGTGLKADSSARRRVCI